MVQPEAVREYKFSRVINQYKCMHAFAAECKKNYSIVLYNHLDPIICWPPFYRYFSFIKQNTIIVVRAK